MGVWCFKNLDVHNYIMLAKQEWRLLQLPNSFLAGYHKAKYFPCTDFLNTHLGSRVSYAWRSIVEGQGLLNEGVRWIGNDQNIWVRGDRWVPVPYDFKITTPMLFLEENLSVGNLIDASSTSWKADIIAKIFNSRDSELILQIPLSFPLSEDQHVWHYISNWDFTVSSAY